MKQRWLLLLLVLVASFGILGLGGRQIALNAPPIPRQLTAPGGAALVEPGQILEGQKSYLGHGGQHIGSIWGHGAYLAPDWTAKALHRWAELTLVAERASGLSEAEARARTITLFRTNAYVSEGGILPLDALRARAYAQTRSELAHMIVDGDKDASIPAHWIPTLGEGERVADFFLWTAWTAATERGQTGVSYTQNWPRA